MFNKRILHLKKTTHCLLRQWERGIQDYLLRRVLSLAHTGESLPTCIIATPAFLKAHALPETKALVVICCDNHLLLTCFFCDHDWQYYQRRFGRDSHVLKLNGE